VRHAGGGLFALAGARLDADLAREEDALALRLEALRASTLAAAARRLAQLPLGALEHVARLYLERCGFETVERIRRTESVAYFMGRWRRGTTEARTLIGVRRGGEPIGRAVVGELRAGVAAKQLDEGLLLGAGPLDAEGEQELSTAGPRVVVLDLSALALELVRVGIGVARNHVQVSYLDADFFAELIDG
jgi:hypothetical protein